MPRREDAALWRHQRQPPANLGPPDLGTVDRGGKIIQLDRKITVGPQGRIALCAVDDTWRGSLSILDLNGHAWRQHLREHTDRVGDIALSADESLAASVSLDHTLRLWNRREDAEAAHLTLDAGLVAVAVADDGSWVAAGSESGTLHFARPVWPETESTPMA